jgi:hypothetical protein
MQFVNDPLANCGGPMSHAYRGGLWAESTELRGPSSCRPVRMWWLRKFAVTGRTVGSLEPSTDRPTTLDAVTVLRSSDRGEPHEHGRFHDGQR